MRKQMQTLFGLPSFGSPQKDRQANILNSMLWLATFAATSRLLIIIVDPSESIFEAAGERIGGVVLLVSCLILLKWGYLRFTTVLLLAGTLISTGMVSLTLGRIAGDPFTILISTLVVSALIAGTRGVLWMGGGSIALVLGLSALFEYNIVPGQDYVIQPTIAGGLTYAIICITITFLLFIDANSLQKLLQKNKRVNNSLQEEVEERRRASEALRQSQDELSLTLDNAPIGILTFDLNGYILRVNHALCKMLGYTASTLIKTHMQDLLKESDLRTFVKSVQQLTDGNIAHVRLEQHFSRSDGEALQVILHLGLTRDADMNPLHIVASVEDVTERHLMQARLQEDQKQESIGILAGGIAHDFNNLLMAMLGQSSLALMKGAEHDPASKHVEKVIDAANKAKLLTSQLLAYAGQGQTAMQPILLNQLIDENRALFAVALGKTITLEQDLDDDLSPISADLGQLQQVVMNLLINAGQAMPKGGIVSLQTELVELDSVALNKWQTYGGELAAGCYALLRVSDKGIGMDRATLSRIFDPFFTTKETGHGLGLAAALGIVRSHGGGLHVQSVIGQGTVFELVFPVVRAISAEISPDLDPSTDNITPQSTILVIEDEVEICGVVEDMIDMLGHNSLVRQDGNSGINAFRRQQGAIDLILLDLTMPGLNGEDTYHILRELNPHVPIVISSGHSRHRIDETFRDAHNTYFLPKPYDFLAFQTMINQTLSQSMTPA